MAALSASRLVCSAMPLMTLTTLPISSPRLLSSRISTEDSETSDSIQVILPGRLGDDLTARLGQLRRRLTHSEALLLLRATSLKDADNSVMADAAWVA